MGNQTHLETSFFADHSNEYLAPKHTVKQYVLKTKGGRPVLTMFNITDKEHSCSG